MGSVAFEKNRTVKWIYRIAMIMFVVIGILFFVSQKDFTGRVADTAQLELGARSGVIDEYIGPLYPMLIRFCMFLQNTLWIPYYIPIYIVQILCLGSCAFYLIRAYHKGIAAWMAMAFVMLAPITVRLLFQVSCYALALAFACLFMGSMLRIARGELKHYLWLVIAYVGLATMKPEYGLAGAAVLFLFGTIVCKGIKNKVAMRIVTILLMFATLGLQAKLEISGGYGRVQRSLSSVVMVNSLWDASLETKEAVAELLEEDGLQLTWNQNEDLLYGLGAGLDYYLGKKDANRYFWELTGVAWKTEGVSVLGKLLVRGMYGIAKCILAFLPIILALWVLPKQWEQEETWWEQRKRSFTRKKCVLMLTGCLVVCMTAGLSFLFSVQHEKNQWKTLSGTMVCFGDSIWGLETGKTGIAGRIEEYSDIQVQNLAVPGTSAASRKGHELDALGLLEQMKQIEETKVSEAQYVVLAYGLNDYYSGVDVSTYRSALEEAVSTIRKYNKQAKIYIIGPTECLFFADGIVVDKGTTRTEGGGFLGEYSKEAEKIATKNGAYFINMQEEIKISSYTGIRYLEDGTHLTEYGRKKYAESILNHILTDNLSSVKLMGNQK